MAPNDTDDDNDTPDAVVRINTNRLTSAEDELPIFSDTSRNRENLNPRHIPGYQQPTIIDHVAAEQDEQCPTTTTVTMEGAAAGTDGPKNSITETAIPIHHSVHDLPSTIAAPLKQIQYSAIKDRCSLMLELTKTIPINEYGLPMYMYRPDLLDAARFQVVPSPTEAFELQEMLSAAVVNISYVEGYPTFDSGLPIWAQLGYEGQNEYMAFTEYLESDGIRSLHHMTSWDVREIREWLILHNWTVRAKAFDLFRSTHHARMRMQRIMKSENNHYAICEDLLGKLKKRVNGFTMEDFEGLDPLQVARALEMVTKVQRVSLGLPGAGGEKVEDQEKRRVSSVEVTMRRYSDHKVDDLAPNANIDEIDLLRDAPEAVAAAQELILRVTDKRRESE